MTVKFLCLSYFWLYTPKPFREMAYKNTTLLAPSLSNMYCQTEIRNKKVSEYHNQNSLRSVEVFLNCYLRLFEVIRGY